MSLDVKRITEIAAQYFGVNDRWGQLQCVRAIEQALIEANKRLNEQVKEIEGRKCPT